MSQHDDPDPSAWRDAIELGETTLVEAREAASSCRACRLWERATQTVFGEGPNQKARFVLVGEQPGDREDLAVTPFVGPAGRLLDDALDEAGIDRKTVYLTSRREEMRLFIEDLRVAGASLAQPSAARLSRR